MIFISALSRAVFSRHLWLTICAVLRAMLNTQKLMAPSPESQELNLLSIGNSSYLQQQRNAKADSQTVEASEDSPLYTYSSKWWLTSMRRLGTKSLWSLMSISIWLQEQVPAGKFYAIESVDVFELRNTRIIAIMLGRLQMSVQESIDTYLRLADTVFSKIHYLPVNLRLNTQGRLNHQALEEAIRNILRDKGLPEDTKLKNDDKYACKVYDFFSFPIYTETLKLIYLLALSALYDMAPTRSSNFRRIKLPVWIAKSLTVQLSSKRAARRRQLQHTLSL